MSEKLEVTRVLSASPAAVYEAWTRPEELARWFAPRDMSAVVAQLDVQVGGQFRVEMHGADPGSPHIATGVFREVVPDESLVMSWSWEGDYLGGETQLSIALRAAGEGKTELTLVHDGFPDAKARDDHEHGWTQITQKLADLFA